MHQGHVKTIEIMNINCGKSPSPRHGILPCHCSPKSPRFRVTTWNPRESQAKQSKQSAKPQIQIAGRYRDEDCEHEYVYTHQQLC
jgi:hypothetical protein